MLDDQARMSENDPAGMAKAVAGFVNQLDEAVSMPMPDLGSFSPDQVDRVLFLGMGGSGIGGTIATGFLDTHGGPISRVSHDYGLPDWVDGRTLVIATSYSGETEETLASLVEARERGAPWMAVTAGGSLAAAAKKHGAPVVTVPGGLQPRAAFGYLTVPLLRLLAHAGLVASADLDEPLERARKACRQIAAECALAVPEAKNPGKSLARALANHEILIMTDGVYEGVAERWRCQLNENSKARAFSRVLPEANHNDTVAWLRPEGTKPWASVWLGRFDGNPSLAVRAEFTRGLVAEAGIAVHEIAQVDAHPLADMIAVAYIGDWVSLYLAFLHGQDPSDVEVIGKLKAKCAATGVAGKAKQALGIQPGR